MDLYEHTRRAIAGYRATQIALAPGRIFSPTERARIAEECANAGADEAEARKAFHAAEEGEDHDPELATLWANAARMALQTSAAR